MSWIGAPVPKRFAVAGVAVATAAFAVPTPARAEIFTAVSAAAGLDTPGDKAGGVAWGDYDGDGCFDLLVSRVSGSRLYHQDAGPGGVCLSSFTDVTDVVASDLAGEASEMCAIWADANNDGLLDFAVNGSDLVMVFLNNGPPDYDFGTAGQANQRITSAAAGFDTGFLGWIDFDNDGALDLVADNHNFGVALFANDGAGNFAEVAAGDSGLPDATAGYISGDFGAVADFNVDGWVDLIVRKEGGADLFVNGTGSFTAIPNFDQEASAENDGGVAFCDFDKDGDFDLVWTDHDSNQVWENTGNGFVATGEPATEFAATNIDGVACADIDNDGDLDLFLSRDVGDGQYDRLFLNHGCCGSFYFETLGENVGLGDGEGAAFADYDRDGDLDLLINQDGTNELWQNGTDNQSYLMVRAARDLGGGIVRDDLGATLRLYDCIGNAVSPVMEVNGGRGHGSQDPALVHFGLPNGPDAVYVVRIAFLAGPTVQRAVVPADMGGGYQLLAISQGDADELAACAAIPDEITLSCPPSVDEGHEVQCSVLARPGPSACTIGPEDTCGGTIDPACLGPYRAPAPAEEVGPGSCTVEVLKGDAADQRLVVVHEVNERPQLTVRCPDTVLWGKTMTCSLWTTDPDLPANAVTCTVSDEDTCGGWLNQCIGYVADDLVSSCVASVTATDDGVPPRSTRTSASVLAIREQSDGTGGAGSGSGDPGPGEPGQGGCTCGGQPRPFAGGAWFALVIPWLAARRYPRR